MPSDMVHSLIQSAIDQGYAVIKVSVETDGRTSIYLQHEKDENGTS